MVLAKTERMKKFQTFDQNSWTNPLRKLSDFRLSQIDVFIVQNGLFSIQNRTKYFFRAYLAKKKGEENFKFLTKGSDFGTKSDFRFSQIDVFMV